MPEIPHHIFMDGLTELIRLDRDWIPTADKGALYIRPLMFATDEFIGVKASETYTFAIFTCPVGPYYTEPVNLLATKEFVRACIGGTGFAKAAGNYAGSLYPDKLAKKQGYHNILWLDAREHTWIEECGTMNVFFVLRNKVVTPSLSGTILSGITRDSVIRLLEDAGYKVESRRVSIYEVEEAYNKNQLKEAFGTGTAATIAPIAKLGFGGQDIVFPTERKIGPWLLERLTNLRTGAEEDPYGWVVPV
jgi:branched-chain amino acid aminotransferase